MTAETARHEGQRLSQGREGITVVKATRLTLRKLQKFCQEVPELRIATREIRGVIDIALDYLGRLYPEQRAREEFSETQHGGSTNHSLQKGE